MNGLFCRGYLTMQTMVGLMVIIVSLMAVSTRAAPAQVRGTWVTTTGFTTGQVRNPSALNATFADLRQIGLNTVYIDAWRDGYTYFPSPTLRALVPQDRHPQLAGRDLLMESIIAGHRNGLAVIPWFQYGFATQFQSTSNPISTQMRNQGWLLQDNAGNYFNSSNNFAWMNPLVPEVRSFVKGIILDAVKKYDLDGIQLDDRLAWPIEFGYDTYTRNAYIAETGVAPPAPTVSRSSTAWRNWVRWRADKVTAFAQELITDLKAVHPNLIISVSPAVHPFAYDNYAVDWPGWRQLGLFDEFVPQVYRSTFSDFDRDWDGTNSTTGGQVQHMGNRKADFAAGISINTSNGAVPWSQIQAMLNLVGSSGVAGHSLWFSDGVLNQLKNELTGYYNVAGLGHAPRPDLPADWRPAPLIASSLGNNQWRITLEPGQGGLYRIVYQTAGGAWDTFDVRSFEPGVFNLTLPGALAVELLVSRQPLSLIPEPTTLMMISAMSIMLLRRRNVNV